MRDRKILYILLLTVGVGSAVTLCTGFLTGGMDWAGQVTVTLEDGAGPEETVTGGNGGPAARMPVYAAGELPEDGEPAAQTEAAGPAAGAGESARISEARTQDEAEKQAEDAAFADAAQTETGAEMAADGEIAEEAAADKTAGGEETASEKAADGEAGSVKALAEAGAAADAGTAEEAEKQEQPGNMQIYAKGGAQQVALSPLETAAAETDPSVMIIAEPAGEADGGASLEENPYYIRLTELDAQIQKNRAAQNAANTAAADSALARNTADNELKLWDSELSAVYNAILKSLDEKQTQELVAAERQWMKNRDAAAVEAAKNSAGGSHESVEYTASLAQSTRTRAYELVTLYASVLAE